MFDVRTMETQLSQALFVPRAAALLFGLAGLMGLLISAVGIYGVISFSVARQTKEIGVRMAMGARRGAGGRDGVEARAGFDRSPGRQLAWRWHWR